MKYCKTYMETYSQFEYMINLTYDGSNTRSVRILGLRPTSRLGPKP